MKKAIIIISVLLLIMPLGFSFIDARDYISDIIGTVDGAIETVKGIFGNDKYNSETPQQNDISAEVKELGIGGEYRIVEEYVEYRIKNENTILNEDFMSVEAVSDTLYDVIVRNKGDILRKRFTAMRLTLSFSNGTDHYEIDVLWIGPYTFDNSDGVEYIGDEGYYGGDENYPFKTSLYWYRNDGMLCPISNSLDIIQYSAGKGGLLTVPKIPKSISTKEQTFNDFWDEWTGG